MKEKILIIDDSGDMRILLARFLKTAGYEIAEAENGEDGLTRLREFMPDLILLDIEMPGIDGYQVCERIKADSGLKDIPVIFLSAHSEAQDKIKGLAIGGVDYITKPFDRGEIMARIDNQLKIQHLTNDLIAANYELAEKQRNLDEDLQAAAVIQQSLLPQKLPQIRNLDIAWKFMPSEKIGGDIFNVLRLDDDHIGFYMVDISGRGVPAALVTFSVSQTLQPHMGYTIRKKTGGLCPNHEIVSPGEVLKALDAEYPWERFEKFLTIIYLIIDLSRGELIYSNAAHPSPVLLHGDGTFELLEKGGTIIGLGGILPFEEDQIKLRDGDKILLYTDGVFEIMNGEGEIFGEKGFYSLVKSLIPLPVQAMVEEIDQAMKKFADGVKLRDDVSILGVEFKKTEI